jgi:hypothetical protein
LPAQPSMATFTSGLPLRRKKMPELFVFLSATIFTEWRNQCVVKWIAIEITIFFLTCNVAPV